MSLFHVLRVHGRVRKSVEINKQRFMEENCNCLVWPNENQPLLCTAVSKRVSSSDESAVLYESRGNEGLSIVCHLGEAHLKEDARGDILRSILVQR